MGLIGVVKCLNQEGELCTKFPSDDLKLGSQIVVYPSQVAFFVKGGAICDEFTSGTYTIETENIPILNKLINLPFGDQSPFKAEVWYVSQLAKLDFKWGTIIPLQIEDPKYHIIVPIRANGQYGIKVTNPRAFLECFIGNQESLSSSRIEQYFRSLILSKLISSIAKKILFNQISVLDINIYLDEISHYCRESINPSFQKYGLDIIEFNIISINLPDNDSSVQTLKKAKATMSRLNITGEGVYRMERNYDILEDAANNSGSGGSMVSMGAGIGVGSSIGTMMGKIAADNLTLSSNTPPSIQANCMTTYFLYVNGQRLDNLIESDVMKMIREKKIHGDSLIWTKGMEQWMKISELQLFAGYFKDNYPPELPF